VGAQGIQSRTATGAVEDDEEEEDEFLRDWQKQRAGRQAKLDEARSSTERDSETVAVMEELRRMEAEGNEDAGGSGESPHVNQPFQARCRLRPEVGKVRIDGGELATVGQAAASVGEFPT